MNYHLSIVEHEGRKTILFANRSADFVEVVFAHNGVEVKQGGELSSGVRGYAYPPRLEKQVRKNKNGEYIHLSPHGGEVVAYVFRGKGRYRDEDMDKPAFLRHKLVDKIKFRRVSESPAEVLRVVY